MRRWLKRAAWAAAALLASLLLILAGGACYLNRELHRSLAQLDGTLELPGLQGRVTVERDAAGVPTLRAEQRDDLFRALGFVHAQERFFQMDLLRRQSAGELSELFGAAALNHDRRVRVHRFRELARRRLAGADATELRVFDSYSEGVNHGLRSLAAVPPEYLLLRSEPRPWSAEDSILVVLTMYLDLQGDLPSRESSFGLMEELLSPSLYSFLTPAGTEWDAPLWGAPIDEPALPAAGDVKVRTPRIAASDRDEPRPIPGSNGWAVAGSRTFDGRAILAGDMHLAHSVPNIWFRARTQWRDADGEPRSMVGVTLPGVPTFVTGSNGHIAWTFTNSQIDSSDLIPLEPVGGDERLYLTPDGPRELERFEERVQIKGREAESIEVEWTIWGPVVDRDHRGRRRAQRWTAHDPRAVDLGLLRLADARSVEEALTIAATTRIPTQNFQVVDEGGSIGWSWIGLVPRRFGADGRTPRSWADGSVGWNGYLAAEAYPRVVNPIRGFLWSANNRVVGSEALSISGDGGFALGARARQIRDALTALATADEGSMLQLQLDDRAIFLERWRTLLLDTLTPEAIEAHPRRAELRRVIETNWSGRASTDSAAFRLVRAFRLTLGDQLLSALTADCHEADRRFDHWASFQVEGALWRLADDAPVHLLDPRWANRNEQRLAAVDALLDQFDGDLPLAERTWGERNTIRVRHPFSQFVPRLARWLDMPAAQLPGAGQMPRVQSPSAGASQRMVVSPGHEEQGLFHMPAGQSGHPLSPFYRAGHQDWAAGRASPLLPGETRYTLTLTTCP